MGVRFACHACGKRLNIKLELAGRRGICPQCSTRFRIPMSDTAMSVPIQSDDALSSLSLLGSSISPRLVTRTSVTATPAQAVAQPVIRSAVSRPTIPLTPQTSLSRTASVAPVTRGNEVFGDVYTTWYVRPPGGGQYGPADGPTMIQWVAEGRVAESSMIWRNGWEEWAVAKIALLGVPNLPWEMGGPTVTNGHRPASPVAKPSEIRNASAVADPVGDVAEVLVQNAKKKRRSSAAQSWITFGLGALLVGAVAALAFAAGWIG